MANGNIEQTPNVYSTPSSPPPTQSYYGETATPKSRGKTIKIIVGVLVGIIFVSSVGVAVALFTRAWDPFWNPFRPEPDKVIQEMTQRMKKIKTMHSESKIEIDARDEYELFNILLTLNSDADATDSKNTKSTGDFDIAFDLKPTGNYTYSTEEIKFSLAGEAKNIGQISYLKINTIPSMIGDWLRSETGIDLNEVLANKWIKIDPKSLEENIKDLFRRYYFGGSLPPEMEEMFQQQTESQKELQEKIEKMIEGKKFFVVKSELSDITTNGIKMYHYVLTLNKAEIKSMIPDFAIIYVDMIKQMMPSNYPLTEEDIYQAKKDITEDFNKVFDEFFVKTGDFDGEVWIGKKDYLIYKVKIEKAIDLNKINQYSKGIFTFKIDMNFSNFDKPVTIETPKDSTDIIEIIMPIIQTSLEQAQKRAKDARIIADVYQIRSIAEMIYDDNNSYEDLCREPPVSILNYKSISYGSMLNTIQEDIRTQQGGLLLFDCLDSINYYCVQAKLNSSDKGRYCIDSSGITGEIQKNQTCVGSGTSQSPYKCPPRSTPIMP